MKRKNLFEYIRSIILAVLFIITILLLYLCFTQNGQFLSISEILGGKSRVISIDLNDYLLPEYSLESTGDGSFVLSFENKKELNKAVAECTKNLLASNSAELKEITKGEYDRAALSPGSIQCIYSFKLPFADFSEMMTSKKVAAPEQSFFNTILFSDRSKECFFMQDFSGRYYKLISGENYYSIDRLKQDFIPGTEILRESYGLYDYEKIISDFGEPAEESMLVYEEESIAENIFGDNFDFVRKITDSFGNQTYMYGYGQKRLSFLIANSEIEFKEEYSRELKGSLDDDLELAITFILQAFGNENENIKLISIETITTQQGEHYQFRFEYRGCNVIADVAGSKIVYFMLKPKE